MVLCSTTVRATRRGWRGAGSRGLEELFLALCRTHDLPQPLVNTRVAGLEVDFLWPAHRLIVETDGYAAHSRPADFERDHERDARLREAHHKVLRFTYRQMTEKPGWVAGNVRSEVEEPGPPPEGARTDRRRP
ncbi:MAG: endonuclease domain-containing protein [Thermoleophilaceae bacterium]